MRYRHGARQIYVRATPLQEDRDEIERAIEADNEFHRWLRERPENLEGYVESLEDERSILYSGPRWEEC